MGTQPYSFVYILSIGVFLLLKQRWVIAAETVVLSWFLCHWLEQCQLQLHSWRSMAFGVSYVLPYCDLNAKFPVHILYVKTRKKDKSGLTLLLVRHNGVWILLLSHYKARCCVYCAMTLKLCLKSTIYINRTRLSIHQNIPKSEGSVVRKIRKFKMISHHDRILLHINKKNEKGSTTKISCQGAHLLAKKEAICKW